MPKNAEPENVKLYQLKGYKAVKLTNEFPSKWWTKSSINRLLKKLRDTGSQHVSTGRILLDVSNKNRMYFKANCPALFRTRHDDVT